MLTVTRGPFLEIGGGRETWIIRGDTAERRAIEVGAIGVGQIEIVSGLVEGDRIIVSDTSRFQDANKVFLRQ